MESDIWGIDIPKHFFTTGFNFGPQSTNILCSCDFNCKDLAEWITVEDAVEFEGSRHNAGGWVIVEILMSSFCALCEGFLFSVLAMSKKKKEKRRKEEEKKGKKTVQSVITYPTLS